MAEIVIYGKGNKVKTTLQVSDTATEYVFPDSPMVDENNVRAIIKQLKSEALVKSIGIRKPVFITPANNSINFNGYVKTSEFSIETGYRGEHDNTDWELSYDSRFIDIAEHSYNNKVNLTTYTFILEKPSYKYYIRCRHNSGLFKGKWSDVLTVMSNEAYIEKPTLYIKDVSTSNLVKYMINGSKFIYKNISKDILKKIRWMVSTDPYFNNILIDKTINTVLTSATVGYGSDLDISIINNQTYYIKAKYVGNYLTSQWSDVLTFVPNKKTLKPVLSGPINAEEGNIVRYSILNYNYKCIYTPYVSSGKINIKGSIVEWHLPFVDTDTVLTFGITAQDAMSNSSVSDKSIVELNVFNRQSIDDDTIICDGTNIDKIFLRSNMLTVDSVLKPLIDIDIMNHLYVSDKNIYWINNKVTELFIGDILVDQNGSEVKVLDIRSGGVTRKDLDTYQSMYWVIPETPLDNIPSNLYLKFGRAISVQSTQSIYEKDFIGTGDGSYIENTINVLVDNVNNTLSNFMINNVVPYIGMKLLSNNNEVVSVINTVNDTIEVSPALTITPDALYPVSTVRVNGTILPIVTGNYDSGKITVTTSGIELVSNKTIKIVVDTPTSNEVCNINIPIKKLS